MTGEGITRVSLGPGLSGRKQALVWAASLVLLGSLVIFAVVFAAGSTAQIAEGANKPPNIVVVMSDDQEVASMSVMSNVQQLLARKGTTFKRSYVSYSLCCPSRATFLTGQYAHNHGVFDNVPPAGGYHKLNHTNTLPIW